MSTNENEPSGYAAALTELEEILASLEQPDVDVDVLSSRVERASQLIAFCRARINGARVSIELAVAGLGED